MKTLRLRRKLRFLTPTEKVEIRAAINARRYLSTKELAKRYKCSQMTIYRLERIYDYERKSRA